MSRFAPAFQAFLDVWRSKRPKSVIRMRQCRKCLVFHVPGDSCLCNMPKYHIVKGVDVVPVVRELSKKDPMAHCGACEG